MARKTQGYNARLDESLGARNRGKKTQTMKSRRDESKGTEKAMGKRAYSAVSTMDKGRRTRKANGGGVASSDKTPQHKRMAMGQKVPQGTKPVRAAMGGAVKKVKASKKPTKMRGGGMAS